jgi:hypothetical protein
MDPRDHPSDLVSDADCAACGRPVPRERVRVLARRDDLAFAELPCEQCGSVSLAIFVGPPDAAPASGAAPAPGSPAIGPDDVLDMHLLLAGWTGDLRTLVGGPDRARGPAGGA